MNTRSLLCCLLLCCLTAWPNIEANAQINMDQSTLTSFNYRCIGPTRGGRVTAVAGSVNNVGTFYMGSTGGGVWKTTDYGANWDCVSDGYFATGSIGAISVAPSNEAVIYVGTGSDGIRSNVITGKGVYKSMDSGKSWESVGLVKTGQIGAVEIHPDNDQIVYVAAIGDAFSPNPERGVYKTIDGGASWEKILFVSDSTGAVDLEFAPNNPDIIYAAMWRGERKPWTIISGSATEGGIYKSTDGGKNWKKLDNGLPQGLFGKSDLAVSAADPNRLYVLIEAPVGEGGVYRSDDQGASFELMSTNKSLLDRPFYYCNLEADPSNADVLYGSATRFFKSTDGGKTWKRRSTPHGDNHDIWIHPLDSNLMIQSNDGGANVSRDGGNTWSSQHNQATAELYQIEVDDQFPYHVYAGQQDNSTLMLPSLPPYPATSDFTTYWQSVGGCETGPVVPKPGNPDIVYANCKGRFGVYNKKTGQEMQYYVGASNMYGHNPKELKFRFQRVAPIHVSPHDPDVVYHCSQYVHKTTDDGQTWEIISPDLTAFTPETQVISGSPITRDVTGEEFYSTIYAIQESRIEPGVIWIGANDGPVHVTKNGGESWHKVTPSALLPGGRIDCVEPSSHQKGKAFFTSLRYQLGDYKPYIFKTEDYGKSWTLVTKGIPDDVPVRVVREDPNREGLLYAGTEFGMYISFDDGTNWQPFQQNLPVTPITDIKIKDEDLVLSTMGRSFWILDDLSPLYQIEAPLASNKLFTPRDAFRMRYRGTRSNIVPYYPGPGAYIQYYLKEKASSPIKLEILDEEGTVIRQYQSAEDTEEESQETPNMATGFYRQGATPELLNAVGVHRFRWDLRHQSANPNRRSGPMAAPGTYTARLTIGGQVQQSSFRVKMDPRVLDAGLSESDLQAQEELAMKVDALHAEAVKMQSWVSDQLKKESLEESKKQALDKLHKALSTAEGRYMTPMIVDQIRYLSSMLDRADQRPGKDALDRYEELRQGLEELKPDFEALKSMESDQTGE